MDINTEIYPLRTANKFTLALASTLSPTDAVVDMTKKMPWTPSLNQEGSLANDYEYVMYGKVYKFDDASGNRVSVYISFGGLLLCISGDYRQLQEFNVGQYVYLLMRMNH